MAYASPMKIANGLVLDFTVDNADTAADTFLGLNASGEVTKFASVPRSRVSGGGNITEATSSVLSITGGTAAVLTSGLTIQVLQAGAGQSGYLSTTDWNTFNNKLGTSLTSGYVYVGNGSNVATGVAVSGDITISNAGVVAIASGVIVNADINASAAIAVSKLAAVTASRVLGSDGSGFIQALDTATYPSLTELAYVKGVTSAIQTQLNNRLSVTLSSPTNGDVITYNGSAWVNSPSSTGVPSGGTTAQILRKIDATNYNTEWHTLVAADITDVSATAAELNLLDGVTTTTAQFNFLNTASGDIQSQLDAKLASSLTLNNIWVGNVSNIPTQLAAGTNGYVLTSVSGVPTWVSPGVGGTVTSVAASGGTTGMSFTGSPITTTGTLTLTGTLAIANGGTGLTALGTANQLIRVNAGATAIEYFTPAYLTTLTNASTTLTGFTDTRILYNNGGLLAEYTISGTGNVAMTVSPVFTTPNIGTATGTASGNWSLASGGTLTGSNSILGAGTYDLSLGTVGSQLNTFTVYADNTVNIYGINSTVTIESVDIFGSDDAKLELIGATSSILSIGNLVSDNSQVNLSTTNIILSTTDNLGSTSSIEVTKDDIKLLPNSGAPTVGYVWTATNIDGSGEWAAASSGFADPMTTRGDIIIRNASNVTARLGVGTATYVLTSDGTDVAWAAPTGGGSSVLSALTAATGANTINNADHAQEWQWNTLGAGTGLLLSSSSTAAASNTNTLFRVNQTGANATSTQTTHSGYFSNTKTGTSSTNIGAYFTASGGTTNYAAYVDAGNLHFNGTGTISAGTSLTLSPTSVSFTGGQLFISSSRLIVFNGGTGTIGADANQQLAFRSNYSTSTTTPFRFFNTNGNYTTTSGTLSVIANETSFAPTSGTAVFNAYLGSGTINQTGGANGDVSMINLTPTITAAVRLTGFRYAPVSGTATTELSFEATQGNMLVPASSYHNWGTTVGTSGYGFRDNAGTMEFKNSGGSWAAFGGGGGIGGSTGATDNSILRADGTGGATLQASSMNLSDTNVFSVTGVSIPGFQISDAGTTTIERALYVEHLTSGTAAAGLGVSFAFSIENASNVGVYASDLQASWNVATAGSEASRLTVRNLSLGSNVYPITFSERNIGLFTNTGSFGSGDGVEFVSNASTNPSTNPANGVIRFAKDINSSSEMYVRTESGAEINISGLFEPVTESGTSFTLNETHRNKIVICSNSGVVTVTVGSGKAAGWNCMLVATNATGTITLSSSGTTLNGTTVTTTQFDTLSLLHYGSENYLCKLG